MIPPDLVARLRMMVEADLLRPEPQVGGVERIRPIPERLPEVLPGQVLRATIQRPLPDGTFQAVVAGRDMTLALDQPVKSGDTLELVVERQVGGTIYARLNEASTATTGAGTASVRAQLSPTGELLRQVLTKPAPERLPLSANATQPTPLLPAAPQSEAEVQQLATALQGSLQRSGLFYESHLAQWAQGRYPLEALRAEPQNVLTAAGQTPGVNPESTPQAVADAAAKTGLPPAPAPEGGAGTSGETTGAASATLSPAKAMTPLPTESVGESSPAAAVANLSPALLAALVHQAGGTRMMAGTEKLLAAILGGALPAGPPEDVTVPSSSALPSAAQVAGAATRSADGIAEGGIPERLVPIVQHQLDTLATQQLHVQFAPWPGWTVFWDLEAPQEREARSSPDEEEAPLWRSRLRLSLPALGDVEAELQWRTGTLEIRVSASSSETSALLREAAPALAASLEVDGIRLTRLEVSSEENADGRNPGG
ncbi:flagellar hook-length control protein FliK [Tepidiphilus margaritifer]|uniref:flagellar hook-length control protein FliK n=1 Tax=Tepidiphilus margaritifer TaxID=203471 RepID=UPI0003F5F4A8|nr:flagellar hook-length control protein FliK [Tepidiphilus margaritifer]